MKYEYSRMNLDLELDGTAHSDEIINELNRLGEERWLLVSPLAFRASGHGTQICSGIIVRAIREPQNKGKVDNKGAVKTETVQGVA